jgi:hypothetical protein
VNTCPSSGLKFLTRIGLRSLRKRWGNFPIETALAT